MTDREKLLAALISEPDTGQLSLLELAAMLERARDGANKKAMSGEHGSATVAA